MFFVAADDGVIFPFVARYRRDALGGCGGCSLSRGQMRTGLVGAGLSEQTGLFLPGTALKVGAVITVASC